MSKPKLDKTVDVPLNLIKDLLTSSEWRMVKQRFFIIQLLQEGLSIRGVAERAKVGTDTVVRVARMIEKTHSIREYLKQNREPTSSKWIFGQAKTEENF